MFESYPDVVTVTQLCRMLQIGKNTAYNLLNSKSIESVRIGRRFLIPKIYVIAYLSAQRSLQDASEKGIISMDNERSGWLKGAALP